MENKHYLKFFCKLLLISILMNNQQLEASVSKKILRFQGLIDRVEIIKDRWGISHIFAQNQKDLFFAQGFNVARDRLFQLEIWRRQAVGTLSEIQGTKALKRDIGARLFRARLDMKQELNHYHPDGEEIITSFVRGINAYVKLTEQNPDLLPIEFKLLGIKPGFWTPEIVVSRHNGIFRNVQTEVSLAQLVKIVGAEKAESLLDLHPGKPNLKPADGIDLSLVSGKILEIYNAYNAARSAVEFSAEDIVIPSYRGKTPMGIKDSFIFPLMPNIYNEMFIGSNNWVITSRHTLTRHPFMANDPHRIQRIPSLRYWIHLVAPGWNVIGGGEPALPGVSIGHNESGAWGLTIFSIDQEDLYIYDTNPENPNQYRYLGKWEDMKILQDTIPVKGASPVTVNLKFTRHGPVIFEDNEHYKVYALRASWLEIGAAPYLASLRMNQARNWQEFREACSYSRAPSENMVWADVNGNIGWQAVGITPIRNNWNGLLPVPGDGRFEWDGYLPIKSLPHTFNPPEGYFATANQDNIPDGYPYSLGLMWSDAYRYSRIQEFLGSGRSLTMTDMMQLQQDELSIPARSLVPLLKELHAKDKRTKKALKTLLRWDFVMDKNSVEAAIYSSWEKYLLENVWNLYIPEEARYIFSRRTIKKMVDWLTAPDGHFGPHPTAGRDAILIKSMEQGLGDLVERIGADMSKWQYGQEKYHHIKIRHTMSDAVKPELRSKLDVGPVPRGGSGYTVNSTTSNFNQTAGASFRIIADLENWDNSLGTNSPGQSGNPDSPHYKDLFDLWAKGKYFPILYTRKKIESAAEMIIILEPK